MNILWITWKDLGHPEAGGAEVVCGELCKRLLADGHSVTILTSDYAGADADGHAPGVKILRAGRNRYLHPFQAWWFYMRHLRNTYDVLIEEVQGGAPYFSVFFERKAKRFVLYHQLARVNWLYEIRTPFKYVGYHLLVPAATRILSLARVPVITVSESTKAELAKFGFNPERTHIISEGIRIEPVSDLAAIRKYPEPTILSHGSMRAMKQTLDQVKAFEIAKKRIPGLKMKLSGSANSDYGRKIISYIAASPYAADIEYLGRTTDEQKIALMRKCHAILVTSVEEGWGLVVTEANSQGTPAVVYDVHGLRDSVKHNTTGIITAPSPSALADGLVGLLQDQPAYEAIRRQAWDWSKCITFAQSYTDLQRILTPGRYAMEQSPRRAGLPLVTVVVTTRNNQATLDACLQSITAQTYPAIELIVVDNQSTDNTKDIARRYTRRVFDKGPERSAQRNFAVKQAKGKYVLIVDSDMVLTWHVIEACIEKAQAEPQTKALIIPEESFGKGFWAQCKRLERSFYVGVDGIEAARFFDKKLYEQVGGYNAAITGGEDWDLTDRTAEHTPIGRIDEYIFHDEGRINLRSALKKRFYYNRGFLQYYNDAAASGSGKSPASSVLRYYKLYLSNPAKLLKNPLYGIGMLFMKTCEFGTGAVSYATRNIKPNNRLKVENAAEENDR